MFTGLEKPSLHGIFQRRVLKAPQISSSVRWSIGTNYPVNDTKQWCPFLHLDSFRNRPSNLFDYVSAHAVNPMLQPHLSRLPLYTVSQFHKSPKVYAADQSFAQALETYVPSPTKELLKQHWHVFQHYGLHSIPPEAKGFLSETYSRLEDPFAKEVAEWLSGKWSES